MKFKYYLRGIGIGIIFASIIFLVAYKENVPAKMSNEEIIARAKQLGMVEANDPINKLIDKKSEDASDKDNISDNTEAEKETVASETVTTEITTEAITEAITTETTTETTTTEAVTTEALTTETSIVKDKKKDGKLSDEGKTTETSNNGEEVEITISRGSSSFPVCQKLFELGLIDDAAKYDDFLIEKGYANRISVGTHKLKKGMDYKTIAELISDPLED